MRKHAKLAEFAQHWPDLQNLRKFAQICEIVFAKVAQIRARFTAPFVNGTVRSCLKGGPGGHGRAARRRRHLVAAPGLRRPGDRKRRGGPVPLPLRCPWASGGGASWRFCKIRKNIKFKNFANFRSLLETLQNYQNIPENYQTIQTGEAQSKFSGNC